MYTFILLVLLALFVFLGYKVYISFNPDKRIYDILPFKEIIQDKYVLLKNGFFVSVIKLQGLDYPNIEIGIARNIAISRFNFFKDLCVRGAYCKIFITKDIQDSIIENSSNNDNKLINDIFSKVKKNLGVNFKIGYYLFCQAKTQKELEELNERVLSVFQDYKAKLLQKKELLYTLYEIVNHNSCNIDYTPKELDYTLSNTNHAFSKNIITLYNHLKGRTIYASVFNINKYPLEFNSDFIDKLLYSNFKLEIIVDAYFIENTLANAKLNVSKRYSRVLLNHDINEQYNTLITDITNEVEGLVNTNISIYIYGNTIEELEENKKIFRSLADRLSYNIFEEFKGSELTYFNRFIGFGSPLRQRPITVSNLTHLIGFSHSNTGLNSSNWGNYPISYFRNNNLDLYKFHFHVKEGRDNDAIAHTVSFAPSGSGKTFLLQHLIAGTMYYYKNVKVYCFDSNLGLKVFINSAKGCYKELRGNEEYFNPLLLNLDDEDEKNFVIQWLQIISLCEDNDSLDSINNAIEILKRLPREKRKLSNLSDLFTKGTDIYKALQAFADGIYSKCFNTDKDNFNISENNLFGFDMTNVLSNEKLMPAILSYIMFIVKNNIKKTNNPALIFIDETAAMLKNKIFANYIVILLKEYRKLRSSINLAFQDLSDIIYNKETIINQCQTRFIFTNPVLNEGLYKDTLHLNASQIDIVKGISNEVSHLRRPLIIQKSTTITIIESDLSYLGSLGKFYSSNINNVNFLAELKEHEADWYNIYQNTDISVLEDIKLSKKEYNGYSFYEVYKLAKENNISIAS